jgi:ABC-type phosphate/phosphonate transport system substrate-binding protein
MGLFKPSPRHVFVPLACVLTAFLAIAGTAATGEQGKAGLFRIGTSGTLTTDTPGSKEQAALETLHAFIKEETGLDNKIMRQKNWRELADKMAKGEMELGVFQGYEFAWAQEKYPELKPLALTVNVYVYPVGYVVVRGDNPAKDFAGLQGQSLSMPSTGQRCLRLFVDRECQANGKKTEDFFAKVMTPDNVEDAIDDVVDKVVQAAVVDRASLEAFKRRKPGRFEQLKEVAKSQPFPPALVAHYDKVADPGALALCEKGLLAASRKEKGETMLTLFRLTGFAKAPDDFEKVLAETRKNYPAPEAKGK